jgi:hypothetical protein
MERLKEAMEVLDEAISDLEDKIGIDNEGRQALLKKQVETVKQARAHEAQILAVAQKVATRLDQAIHHVESIMRH